MFFWQLPPFLIFGIYWTFLHPFVRRKNVKEVEEMDEGIIKKVKRQVEVKWGWYCVLSLLVWFCLIAGIVTLLVENDEHKKMLVRRIVQCPGRLGGIIYC